MFAALPGLSECSAWAGRGEKKMKFARLVLIFVLTVLMSAVTTVPALAVPAPEEETCAERYRIKRGDTLNKIAKRCGLTLSALVMANPQIKQPNRIYAGRTLFLPRKPVPASEETATVVIRPEEDRLEQVEIERLGIDPTSMEHWIDVDLSSQTVSAYVGHNVVKTFLVSTGTWRTPTVKGRFWIHTKFEKDDMRGPGYFLRDVPYTMYFHKGYGLHGTYWHDNFGTPMSHGCVNLSIEDAKWLFGFAEAGTMVYVHP
jgi:lipoprotein-anchoring transpeptidase ErfK/SrfK